MSFDVIPEVGALMRAAFEADALGQFDRAEKLYSDVLALDRANRDVLLYFGLLAAKTGRTTAAIERLQRALTVNPTSAIALTWLSMLLRESGRIQEATDCSERAVELAPSDPDAAYNLGLCYHVQGHHGKAINLFEKALCLTPNQPAYLFSLGLSLEALGADWPALLSVRASARLEPVPAVLLKLGQLAMAVGRTEEAEASARQALAGDSTLAGAHILLAEVLLEANDIAGSDFHLLQAISLDPSSRDSFSAMRARRLRWLGKFDDAILLYEQAIVDQPKQGGAYFDLVNSRKITPEDRPLVAKMQSLLAEDLPVRDGIHLHFALGKALDNLGDYKAAMCHYDEANRLTLLNRHDGVPRFDPARFARKIDAIIELFSKEFIERNKCSGSEEGFPIFVLGMMRSGTTLAEQILSSHRDVGAAGEQGHWTYREHQIVDYRRKAIDRLSLRNAASAYCELLREIDSSSRFVTDKNPANCLVAGLIATALPNARIIQMSRDPVDTCLSIYMTPVRVPPEFGCDRANIVSAYKQYLRLMNHWQTVLSPERFRVFRYEDLVAKREQTTKEMIDFCGLTWDEACLRPEENPGRVSTPSFWQVRQPINSGSVGRWKKYESCLGEFAELLS